MNRVRMNKIVEILFIFFLLIIIETCAQVPVPAYRSFSSFGGDTIEYLRYNFEGRQSFYAGKTMNTLLNDFEVPLKCVIATHNMEINNGLCTGLILSFDDEFNTKSKIFNDVKRYYLIVTFGSNVNLSEADNIRQASGNLSWDPLKYNFFKDVLVKNVELSIIPDPERAIALCDPTSPDYDQYRCINNFVSLFYNFLENKDLSGNNNLFQLQEQAELVSGDLKLTGGTPYDYLQPHARAANSPSLNSQYITVAARVKLQDFYGCGNDAIVSKPYTSHTSPYYQFHLGTSGTYSGSSGHNFSFSCAINGGSVGVSSPPNIWVPGQWYTVVGTYDGATLKLFVNGSLIDSKSYSGIIVSSNTDLFIGKQGNLDYSIPAEIDWVKTYNRALTDDEVKNLSGQ